MLLCKQHQWKKSWHLLHHQTPTTLFSEAQRATVRENRKRDVIKMITLNLHFSDYSENRKPDVIKMITLNLHFSDYSENRKPDVIKMITLNLHFSDYSENRCIHVFSVGFSLFFGLSEVHVFMSLLSLSLYFSVCLKYMHSCV